VNRMLLALEALAGVRDGATLSELAQAADAPKTSLVDLLAGLTTLDCLVRDETGRYRLGPRFMSLAMRAVSGRDLVMLTRLVMTELVAATGETVVLGALAPDADVAIYLDRVETDNPIRYAVDVGERRDLYCTAIGKVLLAHFTPERLSIYLEATPRKKLTPATITSARKLQAELSRVHRDGMARTRDEGVMGASGVAAPIVGRDGTVVAALLVAGPTDRMQAQSKRNDRLVMQAAQACTRLVSGETGQWEETPK